MDTRTPAPAAHIDPGPILQTAFGFWTSKVLLTAVEFGVFTRLGSRRMTGEELGRELELHPRAYADFFPSYRLGPASLNPSGVRIGMLESASP